MVLKVILTGLKYGDERCAKMQGLTSLILSKRRTLQQVIHMKKVMNVLKEEHYSKLFI